jgi:hypothetical protein
MSCRRRPDASLIVPFQLQQEASVVPVRTVDPVRIVQQRPASKQQLDRLMPVPGQRRPVAAPPARTPVKMSWRVRLGLIRRW